MNSCAIEYAKALYELEPKLEEKEKNLTDLKNIFKVFDDDEISKFFSHPEIDKEKKKKVISSSIEDSLVKNFLFVLIDNNRIKDLNEIIDEYQNLLEEEKKLQKVIVYSNISLTKEYLSKLKTILEKKLSLKITLENIIDKTITGGIKISYDSKEIDLTLNSKFKNLVDELKE